MGLRDRLKRVVKRALRDDTSVAVPSVPAAVPSAPVPRTVAVEPAPVPRAVASPAAPVRAEPAPAVETAPPAPADAAPAEVSEPAPPADAPPPAAPAPAVPSAPPAPTAAPAEGWRIHLVNPDVGIDAVIHCQPDETLLDAAEREAIDLPYSCRAGGCYSCAGQLVSGELEMEDQYVLEEESQEMGFRLLCCARPRSDVTVLTHQEDNVPA